MEERDGRGWREGKGPDGKFLPEGEGRIYSYAVMHIVGKLSCLTLCLDHEHTQRTCHH